MGFNSVLLICNDALSEIEKDQEFGKKVAEAISKFSCFGSSRVDIPSGGSVNAAAVYSVEHADIAVLMAAGGNHMTVLHKSYNGGRHHKKEDQWSLLEAAYEVSTKPKS